MAGVEYPPYRPPEVRRFPRPAGFPGGLRLQLPHVRALLAARAAAVSLYVAAAVTGLVLIAPLYPSLGSRGPAEEPGTYPTGTPTRSLRSPPRASVQSIALRIGATSFELYALNHGKLSSPLLTRATRLRVPAD